MIKLNLTYDEFIAILNELAKIIDVQPVNNEVLHGKVDIVRQYDHDDFMFFLNGLKNKELTTPSGWFQAVQYLYENNEIQFVDAENSTNENAQVLTFTDNIIASKLAEEHIEENKYESSEIDPQKLGILSELEGEKTNTIKRRSTTSIWQTPLDTKSQIPIPANITVNKQVEKRIENELINILTPVDAILNRVINIGGYLLWSSIVVFTMYFFMSYDISWWKIILYTTGSIISISAIIIMTMFMLNEVAVYSVLRTFLKLFSAGSTDYYTAIKILTELESSSNIESKLYKKLVSFEKKRIKRHANTPSLTDTEKNIENELISILIPFDTILRRLEDFGGLFGFVLFLVVFISPAFLYNILWWKITLYTIGFIFSIFLSNRIVPRSSSSSTTLFWLISVSFIVCCFTFFYDFYWWKSILYTIALLFIYFITIWPIALIVNKIAENRALNTFLKLYPIDHPDYHLAIKILTELESPNDVGKILHTALISKVAIPQDNIGDEYLIKTKIRNILIPLENFEQYRVTISIFLLGFFYFLCIMAFVFLYDFVWWKVIILSLLPLFISLAYIGNTPGKALESAKTDFLFLFPYSHPQYEMAIKMLKEMRNISKEANNLLNLILKSQPQNKKNDEEQMGIQIQNIIIDLYTEYEKVNIFVFSLGVIVSVLILPVILLFLYDLVWWKILGYSTGNFIFFMLGSVFYLELIPLRKAKNSFLSLFPYEYQQYHIAIQQLREIDVSKIGVSESIANNLLKSILKSQPKIPGNEIGYGKIGIIIKSILSPYYKILDRILSLYNVAVVLSTILALLYFFVFSEIVWWKTILYVIGIYVSTVLLLLTIHPIIFKKLSNSIRNSFLKSFPENHPDYYIAIGILVKMGSGNLDTTLKNFLDRRGLTSDPSSIILSSVSKKSVESGMFFLKQEGDWKEAKESLQNAVNFLQELINRGYEKQLPNLALARFHLGACLIQYGELSAAIKELEKTLAHYQTLISKGEKKLYFKLVETQLFIGICLGYIGDLMAERNALEKSIEEYQTLINQKNTNELRSGLAKVRAKLGVCLFKLDDYEAQTTLEQAQKELQALITEGQSQLRVELANIQKYLALCLQQSEPQTAKNTLENSIAQFQKLIDEGQTKLRPQLLSAKMALGDYYASCNEFSTAREIYETGVKEYQTLIAEGHDELNKELNAVYISLGKCFQVLNELSETDNLYKKALDGLMELSEKGQIFSDEIRKVLAIVQWYSSPQRPGGQDFSEAFETTLIGLDWLDLVLDQVSDTAKSDLIEKNLDLYRLSINFALQFDQPDQAYFILERSKSRVLVEQMLRERAEPGSHIDKIDENLRPKYRELQEKLRLLVNQLDTSIPTAIAGDGTTRFFTPTTRNIEDRPEQQLLQKRQEIENELKKVREDIANADPAFGEAIKPKPLTIKDIKQLISTDTLVIAFEQRPEFLYLYAITTQGIQIPLQINLSSQDVETQAKIFQDDMRKYAGLKNTKIREKRSKETVNELCKWLDSQLKESLAELITKFQPNNIILIPHVAWHLLPIHLVNINDEPLAVRYPVHYLPSMQILRLISERQSTNQGKGCIIANPWSEYLKSKKVKELPGAEKEGKIVYKLRSQMDELISREKATRQKVQEVLNQAQHSHFSCHGTFNQDLTKAGLLLADGLLAAKEMFTSIRMDNPRLVVMSACETAQIKPTLADEYMGLSSSFLFAGAHNVLATQWPVEDNATRLLIENFYQGLNDGLSPVKALQQAQAQLRNMPKETVKKYFPDMMTSRPYPYNNPYYWAGFVLIGDGE
ncbi:CHAT domain-containing protein [Candidatus Halobeggiatoa sp. HSG11]|nr:CHAT domain-containing protein [Candidatus Halobeggiatoa sp. HSG11]